MAGAHNVGNVAVGSPYFTKFSEDHWSPAAETAVMFKDQHYPSASAALDAYINQYEGRIYSLPTTPRVLSDVEALLVHQVAPPPSKLESFPHAGSVDSFNAQRLMALKKMVDDAYARLGSSGNQTNKSQQQTSQGKADLNLVFAESQKLLSHLAMDGLSALPGSSSAITKDTDMNTMSTEALLQAQTSHQQSHHNYPSKSKSSSFRTMEDYVEEARQAGTLSPDSSLLNKLQASLRRMGSAGHEPAMAEYLRLFHADDGSKMTDKTSSPKHREGQRTGHHSANNNNKQVPSWVEDLGSSALTSPSGVSPLGNRHPSYDNETMNLTDLQRQRISRHTQDDSALLDHNLRNKLYSSRGTGLSNSVSVSAQLESIIAQHENGSDRVSMTTDDLIYASPDGRTLKPKARKSTSAQYVSHMSPIGEYARANDSVSSTTDNLLLHSPSGRIHLHNDPSNDYLLKKLNQQDSHKRKEFISQLLEEVEDSPSSIITGYLPDGAMNPYQSPMIDRDGKNRIDIPTPIKLRTLGLLTPETERLLSNPPMPAAMPGFAASPIIPPPSSDATLDHHNVTPVDQEDFTDRVRALLLGPPSPTFAQEAAAGTSDSPRTEEILDGDRDWEKRVTFKLPQLVKGDEGSLNDPPSKSNIVDSFLKDCLEESNKVEKQRLTGGDQPGSMEALKNMLFKVQGLVPGVEDGTLYSPEVTCDSDTDNFASAPETLQLDEGQVILDKPSQSLNVLQDESKTARETNASESFDSQPGADSLHKAMTHLNRLKELVKDKK